MTAAAAPDLLSRFSASVRQMASDLSGTPATAGDIAQSLLRQHPEYVDGGVLVEPGGPAREIEDWLWHCWSLYDPAKTGGVVDGRLLILALARIDERLNAALRRGGRRRLELQRTYSDMAWEWAQPVRVRELIPLNGFDGARAALSRDGTRVATIAGDQVVVWDVVGGDAISRTQFARPPDCLAFSPAGEALAIASTDGVLVVSDDTRLLTNDPADHLAFSPDGRLLACSRPDRLMIWTVDGGDVTRIPYGGAIASAFSGDGRFVAIAARDLVRVWDVAGGVQAVELRVPGVRRCAFTPDGRRLLTTTVAREAKLWELETRRGRELPEVLGDWALSPDGRLLVDGRGGIDLAAGTRRLEADGEHFAFSGDGRLVAAGDGATTRVYELLTGARDLPAVAPDTVHGDDLLDLEADANALADVIAAHSTTPPLSIGLFGDWGSGKSFLIRLVQMRVRELSARAERASEAAHCAHVRNVEFNAWHYADANLWASLATHILDELAKPEDASKANRLLEEIAKSSSEREELARASATVERAAARRKLKLWTWGLVAPGQHQTLAEVRGGIQGAGDAAKLLLPTWWSRAVVVLVPFAVAAIVLGVVGVDTALQWAGAAVTALAAVTTWITAGAKHVKTLLDRAGEGTEVKDVRDADAKAELRAAQERQALLQQELADLSAGRRLARYAAERSKTGDYRSQLGVVSRIHEDFKRMSDILDAQAKLEAKGEAAGDLPRIDRIVLYVDDLDRCPPRRVVEVLEAVHLILALPLFVVVLAVDPRWLLQSLELHYSQLLAEHEGEQWKSSPLNYLEKIIQLPFTLRLMSPHGVAALVGGLLPVEEERETPPPPPDGGEAPAAETAPADTERPARTEPAAVVPPAPLANVNPRTLTLTAEERDFAVVVAGELPTPRAVKKLTNLYRLLRARLDEDSGELDAFLDRDGPGIPECEAVLILLAVLIAFPGTASELLLSFGDLDPTAQPNETKWLDHVNAQEPELAGFLGAMTEHAAFGGTSACEPFRRWALEVSRYSFETGQEVFAGRR